MRPLAVENGAAFTMLTVDPGPDVAPYHNRQMVVLERDDWSAWLDLAVGAEHLVRPSPAGTLVVRRAAVGADEAEPSLAV